MNTTNSLPIPVFQQGVVLLEALIAVLIFSMGILGAVGLQASMIKNTNDAKYRAQAGFVVQQRLGMLWVDQDNLASYVADEPGIDISATSGLPNGRLIIKRADPSCGGDFYCFTIKATWQQPGSDDIHNVTTVAVVK